MKKFFAFALALVLTATTAFATPDAATYTDSDDAYGYFTAKVYCPVVVDGFDMTDGDEQFLGWYAFDVLNQPVDASADNTMAFTVSGGVGATVTVDCVLEQYDTRTGAEATNNGCWISKGYWSIDGVMQTQDDFDIQDVYSDYTGDNVECKGQDASKVYEVTVEELSTDATALINTLYKFKVTVTATAVWS